MCTITTGSGGNYLNDACLNNNYCGAGLTCQGGVCLNTNGKCTADGACVWGSYCNIVNGQCTTYPGIGSSCTNSGGVCQSGAYCDPTSLICVALYSVVQGGKCNYVQQCSLGLECYNLVCSKPSYHFLGAAGGASWGQNCDPTYGEAGCTCNYQAKSFQYLKESSTVVTQACVNAQTDFSTCMSQKSCGNGPGLGPTSCMRQNCYNQYVSTQSACASDPSLSPPVCGANEILVMLLLAVFLILM